MSLTEVWPTWSVVRFQREVRIPHGSIDLMSVYQKDDIQWHHGESYWWVSHPGSVDSTLKSKRRGERYMLENSTLAGTYCTNREGESKEWASERATLKGAADHGVTQSTDRKGANKSTVPWSLTATYFIYQNIDCSQLERGNQMKNASIVCDTVMETEIVLISFQPTLA